MLRILIFLLIALLPTIIFTCLVIWALGTFGYTPLQPLANAIGQAAEPVMGPLMDKIRGTISSLPGGPGARY